MSRIIEWSARPSRPLLHQPVTLASLTWLVLAVLGAVLSPLLASEGPLAADTTRSLLPPGTGSLMGTDLLGREISTRLLWGGRWTLGMGFLGLAIAVGLGLPAGLAAGFLGGRIASATMQLVDALLAFPGLLLAMAVVAVLGPGMASVAIAVGLAAAPAYARVARSAALEVRTQPYVEAVRALGGNAWRTMTHHVLPNAAAPLAAFAATQLGWILLNSAALNFLGLGVPLGAPEWGAMLDEGQGYLRDAPWVSAFPGAALTLTVLAANLLGDSLQKALQSK
jgi:ABC-type dipeptide/oligopeptide/nickel transport system permease subunit